MKLDIFETACSQIIKIKDICSQVPEQFREETYKFLLDALLEDTHKEIQHSNSFQEFLENCDIKEYIEQKKPASNIERSLLFVYYLETYNFQPITIQMIDDCYKKCNFKTPTSLSQNLRDACGQRYGYLKYDNDTYFTTDKGKEFCRN